MRILTVTHFFHAHGGGIEIVAGRLCEEFHALGHQPVWAASDADRLPETAKIDPLPLRCFNMIDRATGLPIPIPSFAAMRALSRAVRSSDAVVIHDALYITSIIAMVAARRGRKPTVLIQHIADLPLRSVVVRSAVRLANSFVAKPMLRAAGRVVYISATTQEAFSNVAIKASPLLLFNGVDTAIFHVGAPNKRNSLRSGFSIPAESRLCLFVGRFVEKKGLSVLAALAKMRPDLHFALAGRGPIEPASWGLKNVAVCRDLPQSTLAELYRAADVFVLPSVGEGYPLVIQEAMACGLPVICGAECARADPAASKWLTGVPIALDRPEDTARAINAAIDALAMSGEERLAMADYAARRYSWPKMASEIIAAIEA